jgi:hypothetical protein
MSAGGGRVTLSVERATQPWKTHVQSYLDFEVNSTTCWVLIVRDGSRVTRARSFAPANFASTHTRELSQLLADFLLPAMTTEMNHVCRRMCIRLASLTVNENFTTESCLEHLMMLIARH